MQSRRCAPRGTSWSPTAWGAASPSAHVTTDAFERIVGGLISHLKKLLPVDGVYLDLHGAMVTEAHDDGEGEILHRVREVVGPRVPVAASLDLHCNFTQAMFDRCDALVAYRTYPHVDMADTGALAARLLDRMLRAGKPLAKHYRTLDYLTGLPSQCSFIAPCKAIYEHIGRSSEVTLSFTPGFRWRTFRECGMAVFGLRRRREEQPSKRSIACTAWWPTPRRISPSSCTCPTTRWPRARSRGEAGRPVVLADTQDNPGAGGNGDTTGLSEIPDRSERAGSGARPAHRRRCREEGA